MTVLPDHPIHLSLLRQLFEIRFATTEQLARLTEPAYGSRRSAIRQTTRHLTTLEQTGLVLRLDRRIGGWRRGSAPTIWTLTTSGHRSLTGQRNKRLRPHLTSTTFLEHLLAVAETRVIVAETLRHDDADRALMIQGEPSCWRTYLGPYGQQLTLRPDLHITIRTVKYEDRYFIEVDRATENPARVVAKCQQYVQYRRTGTEQKSHGVFPAVLWIVPTITRRDQLRRHLAAADLPSGMFHALTLADLPGIILNGPPTDQNISIRKENNPYGK